MDKINLPNVLILSINPLDLDSNNGRTISSFFHNYPVNKISQFFFHRTSPNSSICNKFYRISDEDIISFLLRKNNKLGKIVVNHENPTRIFSESLTNKLRASLFFKFLRNLLFTFTVLFNRDYIDWLNSCKPEIIFLCGGDTNFLYPLAIAIARKFNIKIINYVTDDYLLMKFTLNPFYYINRLWTKIAFLNLSRKPYTSTFTIGPQMSEFYLNRFGIKSKPLMNLVNIDNFNYYSRNLNLNRIVYIGGLHSNRWKVIKKLIVTIKEKNLPYSLDIFTFDQLNKGFYKFLKMYPFVNFKGSIKGKEVSSKLLEYDILLHVEAFDYHSRNITFLSISTKIPEYLSTGKPILAIGPKSISSMKYLSQNRIAITCNNYKEIQLKIATINNQKLLKEMNLNSYRIIKRNHDIKKVSKEFQEGLINLRN